MLTAISTAQPRAVAAMLDGDGTVFELSPRQGGGYTETVLHNFGNGTDGYVPYRPA